MEEKEAIEVLKNIEEHVKIDKIDGEYKVLFTHEFVGALETAIEALKIKYYEDMIKARRNPCNDCEIGWARISSEGVTGCHDHCEKLRAWAEALGIGV